MQTFWQLYRWGSVLLSLLSINAQILVIDLNPPGASSSYAAGISGSQVVGSATLQGSLHAGLWSGNAPSFVDLNPPGATAAEALCTQGSQQGGHVLGLAGDHAALWSGTANSFIDLGAAMGGNSSRVLGIAGSQQVGFMQTHFGPRAILWSGTAESYVDLTPPPTVPANIRAVAYSTTGAQQVGYVGYDYATLGGAALWSGTPESYVNLNPSGAEFSKAFGIDGSHQVGEAQFAGVEHAALWSGTAQSFLDLNPVGAQSSQAAAISGPNQVGYAIVAGQSHAALWSGTADSFVDLNSLLPSTFTSSTATAIFTQSGGPTYIVGTGSDGTHDHAIQWILGVPEPDLSATSVALGLLALVLWRVGVQRS